MTARNDNNATTRSIGQPMDFDQARDLGVKLSERFNLNEYDVVDVTHADMGYIPMVRITYEQAAAEVGVDFIPLDNSLERGTSRLRGYSVEGGLLEVEVPFIQFTIDRLATSKERVDGAEVTSCGCIGPAEVHGMMTCMGGKRKVIRLCPRGVEGHPAGLIYDQNGHVERIVVQPNGQIAYVHSCNIGGRRCGRYTRHYSN